MLKNIVQLTLLSVLWKRYKNLIVSTLLMLVYFWLVGKLHQDYVSYSELNNNHEYLALSYIIKWTAFILGASIYLLLNSYFPRPKKPVPTKLANDPKAVPEQQGSADPFTEIRHRKKLRSRADFVIEKHRNNAP
jgi:hypothetical protein